MTAIHNEQTTQATALNNIAVACVVIGFVTPITAMSFGVANAPILQLNRAIFTVIWLCTGAALHYGAKCCLRSLKP